MKDLQWFPPIPPPRATSAPPVIWSVVVGAAFGGLLLARGHRLLAIVVWATALLLALGLNSTVLRRPILRAAQWLGAGAGRVTTLAVLWPFYVLVFGAFRLALSMARVDLLGLRLHNEWPSYWQPAAPEGKRAAHSQTHEENLCLAGGVALNCVANGVIARAKMFRNIWIQPAAGDAGGALGAALFAWHQAASQPRTCEVGSDAMRASYLGTSFSDEDVQKFLAANAYPYRTLEGEALLPLEQWANQVRSVTPAITHVDYSARIQAVSRQTNPDFHTILSAFQRMTGCPLLVNTSFNVRSEPIVCTPAEAYQCFMRTGIDVLVLDKFLLHKSEQPPWEETVDWKQEFGLD